MPQHIRCSRVDLGVPVRIIVRDLRVPGLGMVLHARPAGPVQRLRLVLGLDERRAARRLAVISHGSWSGAADSRASGAQKPSASERGTKKRHHDHGVGVLIF